MGYFYCEKLTGISRVWFAVLWRYLELFVARISDKLMQGGIVQAETATVLMMSSQTGRTYGHI